jgi:predicted nucleic acid-binding protein
MRVLFDTNILIYREYEKVLSRRLQELMRAFYTLDAKILVHPYSLQEISQDKNLRNNELILSKVKSYPTLEPIANPNDDVVFLRTVGEPKDARENVDNHLLYSVYKGEADILITQDPDILEKSGALNISEKVFDLKEGLAHLGNLLKERQKMPLSPTGDRSHAPVICFYRKGNKWIIGEKGKEAIFDNLKGFGFIHCLLTNANKDMFPEEVFHQAFALSKVEKKQLSTVRQPYQREIDYSTRGQVLNSILKLEGEASSGGIEDPVEYDDKKIQVSRLKKHLVPTKRRLRDPRSESEKARINVGKRIRDAIQKIKADPAVSYISRYINRATILTGDSLQYRPNPKDRPRWLLLPPDEIK